MRIDHPAAFSDIKYWEIGNEEYGSWEVDHHGAAGPGGVGTGAAHDPATYAAFAAQFASLASEIQTTAGLPQISIGIDSGDPTGASDGNWTKNVLADGLADGFVPGFISDHSYMQAPGEESDSFLLDDTVSDSGSVLDWTTRYADYQAVLQQTLGSQASSVQVMATEYNSVYTNPGKQSTSLVNGLFVAESLGSLMDSGYSGGFVWDLRNYFDTSENNSNLLYGWREGGDYGQLGDPNETNSPPATGPYVAYPGYYALQLASKIIQSGGQVVSAASNYSDLNVYAVMESSGNLELLVINANPAASLTEQFDLTGFQPGGPAQVWQYGETQDTAQSHSATGASALASASTSVSLSGSNFSYVFPAYSMTVLDLSPPPSLSGPATATVGHAQTLAFSGATAISVSDSAATGSTIDAVALSVQHGTIAVEPQRRGNDHRRIERQRQPDAQRDIAPVERGLGRLGLYGPDDRRCGHACRRRNGRHRVERAADHDNHVDQHCNDRIHDRNERGVRGGDGNPDYGDLRRSGRGDGTAAVGVECGRRRNGRLHRRKRRLDAHVYVYCGRGTVRRQPRLCFDDGAGAQRRDDRRRGGESGQLDIARAGADGLAAKNIVVNSAASYADFNGDGTSDVLYQNTDGSVGISLMKNGANNGWVGLSGPTSCAWSASEISLTTARRMCCGRIRMDRSASR